MNAKTLKEKIAAGALNAYGHLYQNPAAQKERYLAAIDAFTALYGADRDIRLFSVPGRSELGGNHTDHNHGKVLAGAIDRDILAVAAKNDEGIVRVHSEGYPEDAVPLSDAADPDAFRRFNSRALLAGTCGGFLKRGYAVGGYDAYTTTQVLTGSGISSSAAFEVMIGNIENHLANGGKIGNPEIAKISQFAENVYFGKPCGLMDQMACAVGGFVAIDFEDPQNPVIESLDFDLSGHGYSLCIVNTGGNHADLNEDYASVPAEMKKIAAYYGKDALRGLTEEQLISDMPVLRKAAGDRAILRAMHFVAENKRVEKQTEALRRGDLDTFFAGVIESGNSSFKYLQNVYTVKNVEEQGLSLALCVTEYVTRGWGGAFRVHGGGFAGTIQAFIPTEKVEEYTNIMNSVFGQNACAALKVRPEGAILVNL